jgi:drug/metabolite transporter (DMT)-like permease
MPALAVTAESALGRGAAEAALAAVAVVWGVTFPLGKLVLRHIGPFQYLALRFGLAAAVMAPLVWRDRGRLGWPGVRAALVAGTILYAGYALQTLGLRDTSAGNAGLITGLNVLCIPLILLAWHRRPPNAALAAAVGLAVVGLWLLLYHGQPLGRGDALVLGCAVALALQAIVVGHAARAVPAAAFTCIQLAVVAVLAGASAALAETPPAALPAPAAGAIVFMALAATLGAYIAQTWAQRIVSPTRTGVLFALEPVAAVVFAAWWLGESLGPRQAAGAAAILLAVVFPLDAGRPPGPESRRGETRISAAEGGREHGFA